MPLPRTFVSFSSTDYNCYQMMRAWKANDNTDFNFVDCQLERALDSENEQYIKRSCRERLRMAGTFLLLIGHDTATKHRYVGWEVSVAIEQGARLLAINLNHWRYRDDLRCPTFMAKAGALHVTYSPNILQWALENFTMPKPQTHEYYYADDSIYQNLGYTLGGGVAKLPPRPNPFLHGKPDWAK